MKKFILILLFAIPICQSTLLYAEQRYNAFEDRWETVQDGSNDRLKYNAFEDDWSYQPDNAQLEYNAWESKWEWDGNYNCEGR